MEAEFLKNAMAYEPEAISRIKGLLATDELLAWLAERKARFAALPVNRSMRRFIVGRQGITGSTWFARVLNSHPAVYCSHEAAVWKAAPRMAEEADIADLIEAIAVNGCHGAYRAAGDVGSVWVGHILCVPDDLFSKAVLVRHPLRMLASRVAKLRKGGDSFIPPELEKIETLLGIPARELDSEHQVFLNDCLHWLSTAVNVPAHLILRIEDLVSPPALAAACQSLTGVDYPKDLLEAAVSMRVNTSDAANASLDDLFAILTETQRQWYGDLVAPTAAAMGYDAR